MKKILYIIRIISSLILIFIAVSFILVMIFGKQAGRSEIVAETFMMCLTLALLFLGIYIYPYRTKYCSCGRKYTSMKYEYVECKTCKGKIKDNIKTIPYQYVINEVYFCEHCNKEYKRTKNLYGGEMINYLENGTYEDKKISYEDALNNFKKSQKKK